MENQKLKLLLASISVLIFALVAVFISNLKSAPAQSDTSNVVTETPVQYESIAPEEELKLQEQVAPLIASGDINACEQVQNKMYRAVCINNIALKQVEATGDITKCQLLDDVLVSRSACEQPIIQKQVLASEDITTCTRLGDPSAQAGCEATFYAGLAAKKQDPSICDQDPNKERALICFNGYHAENLLRAAFMDATTTSICTDLRGESEQADCETVLPLLEAKDFTKITELCTNAAAPATGTASLLGGVCMFLSQSQIDQAVVNPASI